MRVSDIQRVVAAHYDLPPRALRAAKRPAPNTLAQRRLAHARNVAMYLTRHLLEMHFAKIGAAFGARAGGTPCVAYYKIRSTLLDDEELAAKVDAIVAELEAC